jgi:hypothetical protein
LDQRQQVTDSIASILTALLQLVQKSGSLAQNMTTILSGLANIATVVMNAQHEEKQNDDDAQAKLEELVNKLIP